MSFLSIENLVYFAIGDSDRLNAIQFLSGAFKSK